MLYVYSLFENDLFLIAPEVFLFFSTTALLIFSIFTPTSKFLNLLTALSILICFQLFFLLLNTVSWDFMCFNWLYITNPAVNWLKLFSVVLTGLVFFAMIDYFRIEKFNMSEYSSLLLFSLFAVFFIFSSNDFILLYLALELLGLISYVLAASRKYSNFSSESGLKYFVLSSFSSVLILESIALLYGVFGTTNYTEIFDLTFIYFDLNYSYLMFFSLLLLFVGILFKVALAPFHFWAPDVYEGSPTIIVMFFSSTSKLSFIYILYKLIFDVLYSYVEIFSFFLLLISFISVVLGSFSSFYQVNLKRLISYSSISHSGFILLCLIVNTYNGLLAFYFYLFIYLCLVVNFFIFLTQLRLGPNYLQVTGLNFFFFFFKSCAALSLCFSVLMFSFAGIPPLAGFFGKLFLFYSLLEIKSYILFLALFVFITLSAVYYIRLVVYMYFVSAKNNSLLFSYQFSDSGLYLFFAFLYFNLFFVLFQDWIFFFIHNIFIDNFFLF